MQGGHQKRRTVHKRTEAYHRPGRNPRGRNRRQHANARATSDGGRFASSAQAPAAAGTTKRIGRPSARRHTDPIDRFHGPPHRALNQDGSKSPYPKPSFLGLTEMEIPANTDVRRHGDPAAHEWA